jgi:DNA-binding response OmpR family regulator
MMSPHPSVPSAPSAQNAPPRLATAAVPGAPTLLIAEDDPDVRQMLRQLLKGQFNVYEAPDGQTALEMLARLSPPDAIVLDVMMPRLDGFAVAARIKADPRLQGVPLMFLTACDGFKETVGGINAGARHYITKPFIPSDLVGKLKRATRNHAR